MSNREGGREGGREEGREGGRGEGGREGEGRVGRGESRRMRDKERMAWLLAPSRPSPCSILLFPLLILSISLVILFYSTQRSSTPTAKVSSTSA